METATPISISGDLDVDNVVQCSGGVYVSGRTSADTVAVTSAYDAFGYNYFAAGTGGVMGYSAWVTYATKAASVYVFSDERIKENIQDIVDDEALKQLRLLQPKTYEYKDKFIRGTKTVIGFIAQEVREVLPHAVNLIKNTIPDILKSAIVYNLGNNIIKLKLLIPFEQTILKVDDLIEILIKDSRYEVIIRDSSNDAITIKIPEILQINNSINVIEDGTKCVVYGHVVDDFHILEKSGIFTNTTASVQELDRQLQSEKQKVVMLKKQMNEILLKLN